MKTQVDMVMISPKKAMEYLDNLLDGQRAVRESWVKQLADDMRTGKFKLSCDCLVLVKGKLANGQHRMWAVVEANTSQPFILMRTDDEELYKVIDAGLKRTVGDAVSVANGSALSAESNLTLAYEKKTITQFSFTKKATRVTLIEYIEKNSRELSEALQMVSRVSSGNIKLVTKSAVVAFAYLATKNHGQARVEEFLRHLYAGDQPEEVTGNLRERFLKVRMGESRTQNMTAQMGMALIIKAFNAHVKNTTLSKFNLRMVDGENYPQLAVPAT